MQIYSATNKIKFLRGPLPCQSRIDRLRPACLISCLFMDDLSCGKDDAEASASADFRFDSDSAVVQLHGAEGLRKADAAALGFGGVIKVEDLVARVFGYSGPAVGDGDEDAVFFVAAGLYREPPAVRHDLAAVDDDVEDGLFEQVGVGFDEQRA